MINTIILVGRVANPELRINASGTAMLKFRLATSLFQGADKEDKTMWTDCVVWQKQAESLGKILQKGMKVVVQGSLDYNEWEDRNGNKRSAHSIKVQSVELPPREANHEDEVKPAYEDADIPF